MIVISDGSADRRRRRKANDRERGSRQLRLYGRDWELMRRRKLVADPLCALCLALGHLAEATTVHHLIPIRERPDLRLAWDNLQSLCKRCHDKLEHGFVRNPVPRHGCDENGMPRGDHPWNRR